MKRRNFLSGLLAAPLALKARLAQCFGRKPVELCGAPIFGLLVPNSPLILDRRQPALRPPEETSTTKLPRAILADDHTPTAEALHGLVATQFDVVATVADGCALLVSALALKPDVVVVDVALRLLNGLEACRQLKQKMPAVKLVFLTMNEDPELAVEAMKAGGSGYVLKKSAASDLLPAMHAALRGRTYVTPQIARGMEESFIRNPQGRSHPKALTARQREVVQLLAEGKSMKEVAAVLKVAPRTVAFHKYRVMQDLGFNPAQSERQFRCTLPRGHKGPHVCSIRVKQRT